MKRILHPLLWIFAPVLVAVFVWAVYLGSVAGVLVPGKRPVILYCAQDQVFAEPLLAEFTRTTGIRVRPVFDSEAVKTVGLANRLVAEKKSPRADVWWSNEELRTRQLAARGVFGTNRIGAGETAWIAFGARHRCLVWRPGQPPPGGPPASLVELTNTRWQGRVSLAFPLFGTTATHLLALRSQWGGETWNRWCTALAANKPFLEEGNSQVTARVARGEAWVGLTDSDDLAAARREGLDLAELPVHGDLLNIPNTVALVRPAGPDASARRLVDFLAGDAVRARLVEAGALDPAVRDDGPSGPPDWARVLANLDVGTGELEGIFRR